MHKHGFRKEKKENDKNGKTKKKIHSKRKFNDARSFQKGPPHGMKVVVPGDEEARGVNTGGEQSLKGTCCSV